MSYPARNLIPIHLIATSEDDRVIDLVSSVDVQLFQVLVFGNEFKIKSGFSIGDLSSLHPKQLAAKVQWELDSYTRHLPPTKEYPRSRWHVKIKGHLHQHKDIQLTQSIRLPDQSLVVGSFNLSRHIAAD
jgi:hypothetical protein